MADLSANVKVDGKEAIDDAATRQVEAARYQHLLLRIQKTDEDIWNQTIELSQLAVAVNELGHAHKATVTIGAVHVEYQGGAGLGKLAARLGKSQETIQHRIKTLQAQRASYLEEAESIRNKLNGGPPVERQHDEEE